MAAPTPRLASSEQQGAIEDLVSLHMQQQDVHTRTLAAVQRARSAGLSDPLVAQLLGLHRNTLLYRYGARGQSARGQALEAVVPSPRASR